MLQVKRTLSLCANGMLQVLNARSLRAASFAKVVVGWAPKADVYSCCVPHNMRARARACECAASGGIAPLLKGNALGSQLHQRPYPTHYSGAYCCAMLPRHSYAVGGWNEHEKLSDVERYDAIADTWTQVAPMQTIRYAVRCAVLAGSMYAIGGHDQANGKALNTGERYDWTDYHVLVLLFSMRNALNGIGQLNGRFLRGGRGDWFQSVCVCVCVCVCVHKPTFTHTRHTHTNTSLHTPQKETATDKAVS